MDSASALLIFACVSSAAFSAGTLVAAWYERVGYRRFWRPDYDPAFHPSCAVIVPCKGATAGLASSLQAFFDLEGGAERVVFAVESEQDPAHALIRDLIRGRRNASLVVAGLATTCAQMNQNLIAGVRAAGTPEVYVFADAQLRPGRGWLEELLLPLSRPGIAASTGFRWPLSSGSALGQFAHVHSYLFLHAVFAAACVASSVGLWGGAMAIRRKDFDELDVAGLWSRTSTPDMSLSRLIVDEGRKAVLVPTCIVASDDLLQSPLAAVHWFERQCMYLKAHYTFIWALVVFPSLLLFALQLWLPIAVLLAAATDLSFHAIGGTAALALLIGELVNACLFALLGKIPGFGRYLLCQPVFRAVPILGLVRTLFTRTILWSGVRYRLHWSGAVKSVTR